VSVLKVSIAGLVGDMYRSIDVGIVTDRAVWKVLVGFVPVWSFARTARSLWIGGAATKETDNGGGDRGNCEDSNGQRNSKDDCEYSACDHVRLLNQWNERYVLTDDNPQLYGGRQRFWISVVRYHKS